MFECLTIQYLFWGIGVPPFKALLVFMSGSHCTAHWEAAFRLKHKNLPDAFWGLVTVPECWLVTFGSVVVNLFHPFRDLWFRKLYIFKDNLTI